MTRMRTCISGIGVVSPVGIGREAFWTAIAEGRSGITEVDLFDRSGVSCRAGGQVRGFDAAALIGPKGLRYVDRPSQFALAAAQLAMTDAGVDRDRTPPERVGVVLGTAFVFPSFLTRRITAGTEVLVAVLHICPTDHPSMTRSGLLSSTKLSGSGS